MALSPKTATLFLIDCSASMDRLRTVTLGEGKARVPAIAIAKQYVKAKVVQRIMRELKTTPFGVICFAHAKTKNVLTTRAKEKANEHGEPFDRKADPYRHCYELLPFTYSMDQSLLPRIDDAAAGEGPDGDAFSALILGIETLGANPKAAKYTKEICILTDGESEIDWDGLTGVVNQMNDKAISLTVVGMDFDDEDVGFVEEGKSDVKRENETNFHELVNRLEQPSLIANVRRAITAITTPQLRMTNSRADRMTLKLGDPAAHPDSALTMWIEVKKAIAPATAPTMKRMSMRGFEHVRTQAAASQSQSQSQAPRGMKRRSGATGDGEETDEDDLDNIKRQARFAEKQNREQRAQMLAGEDVDMAKIGVNYEKTLQEQGLAERTDEDADLISHNVLTERRFFYRPPDKAKEASDAQVQAKKKERAESDEEDDGEDEWREAVDANLTDAYYYGGSLVPVGDLEDDAGSLADLQMGMEIVTFLKQSDIRYEWRMGDLFYVYAAPGQITSEKTFSALVNAMNEKRSAAVVRFVKKGYNSSKTGRMHMPDPQVGILFPQLDDEGVEYCYWARLPYAEDIRSLTFPSLDRLFNRKGHRLQDHKFLPTEAMDEAMDAFVDAMDLSEAGAPDEEGDATDWFTVEDSFSPAIHNIQNTLIFRLSNPDSSLPPVPSVLTKYMDPPRSVVEKAEKARNAVIKAFEIKLVPPKPKKINKSTQNYVTPGDDHLIDADEILGTAPSKARKNGATAAGTSNNEYAGFSTSMPDGMQFDGEGDGRSGHSSPAVKDEDVKSGITLDGDDEDEDDAEPDTEDEEPATEDEDEGPPLASQGRDLAAAFAEAEKLVRTSFSRANYGAAADELKRAGDAALRTKSTASYNAGLRSFIAKFRDTKKSDFLRHLLQDEIGLVGVADEEAQAFFDGLA
ncbi:hypothetical protein JCM11641_000485 [Rhodosporidiobolus odoratus]